jgi:hypothetical protein
VHNLKAYWRIRALSSVPKWGLRFTGGGEGGPQRGNVGSAQIEAPGLAYAWVFWKIKGTSRVPPLSVNENFLGARLGGSPQHAHTCKHATVHPYRGAGRQNRARTRCCGGSTRSPGSSGSRSCRHSAVGTCGSRGPRPPEPCLWETRIGQKDRQEAQTMRHPVVHCSTSSPSQILPGCLTGWFIPLGTLSLRNSQVPPCNSVLAWRHSAVPCHPLLIKSFMELLKSQFLCQGEYMITEYFGKCTKQTVYSLDF